MQIDNPYQQYMYSYPHKTAYRQLKDICLKDFLGRLVGKENSLYFHIPFCQYKCGYCNLFSVTGQSEQRMADYVEAMERQAVQLSDAMPSSVVFCDLTVGGGTPLILPTVLLRRLFRMAEKYFSFEAGKYSMVVETSPNQTTEEKLDLLKEEGVTRISIGVQSFQEDELAVLHRFHSVGSAKKALDLIKKADFDCMNIDLIYGIPGQTADRLLDSLMQALSFEPEELFVYPLYIKPETFLYRQGAARAEDALKMYQMVREVLREAGYHQYSMRRFVKRSAEDCQTVEVFSDLGRKDICRGAGETCVLPETLCGFGNTVSVGCGGRSYIGNLHFCTPYAVKQEHCLSVLEEYVEIKDYLQVSNGFLLSEEEERRRYVIRHILFGRGIDRGDYQKHFGTEVLRDFPVLADWERAGYAAVGAKYITLTSEGVALSDYLGPQLISSDVREKSEQWRQEREGR